MPEQRVQKTKTEKRGRSQHQWYSIGTFKHAGKRSPSSAPALPTFGKKKSSLEVIKTRPQEIREHREKKSGKFRKPCIPPGCNLHGEKCHANHS